MADTDSELLEKLQKILARTKSPNAHEAEAAMAKVEELLVRHNLTIQDVEGHRAAGGIVEHDQVLGSRLTAEVAWIGGILDGFFFVKVLGVADWTGKRSLRIVGRRHNVEVARHVYEFLSRTYRRLFRDLCKRLRSEGAIGSLESYRKSYYKGLTEALAWKLEDERDQVQQEAGLVLVSDPELDERVADVPERKARKVEHSEAARRVGWSDGGRIDLRGAVSAGEATAGRLT